MASTASRDILKVSPTSTIPFVPRLLRLAILIAIDVFVVWLLNRLVALGFFPLAAAFLIITIFVNVVILRKEAYPIRWMVVGLVLMALFTIYSVIFTIWVAFTNYGESHLITKQQALDQFLNEKYLPEAGKAYTWTAFKSDAGDYTLWLTDADGNGYLATPGEPLIQPQPGELGVGELDAKGIPATIEGYQRLNAILAATDKSLPDILFGEAAKNTP